MKTKVIILTIIMLLWASPAMGKIDTESVGLFTLRLIDFKQTLDIADSGFYIPDSAYIKRHPSSNKINYDHYEKTYCLVSILAKIESVFTLVLYSP